MSEIPTVKTIELAATYDAQPDEVFKAWTEPARFASWFGAPADTVELDVRPGGRWKATLVAEGTEVPFAGEYREVRAPEKLVFTLADPDDPGTQELRAAGVEDATVTITLAEVGGKTKMTFQQTGALPEEDVQDATEGWKGWFEALGQHLASR